MNSFTLSIRDLRFLARDFAGVLEQQDLKDCMLNLGRQSEMQGSYLLKSLVYLSSLYNLVPVCLAYCYMLHSSGTFVGVLDSDFCQELERRKAEATRLPLWRTFATLSTKAL